MSNRARLLLAMVERLHAGKMYASRSFWDGPARPHHPWFIDILVGFALFRDHSCWRALAGRGCRRRDRECDPRIPAVGTVLRGKFVVVLQIEIALQVADRKDEAELRASPDHLRLKAADAIAGAAVAADLLIDIAHRADLKLLGHELRGAPIKMHVDAALILVRLIFEIVGKAENAREFVPGLRIEIGVAAAGIDRAVPEADIREAGRGVGPDPDIPPDISHVVLSAPLPAQRR